MDNPSFIFKKPKGDIFWLLASFMFIGISIYITLKIFTSDSFKPVAIILPFVFATVGITLLRVCLTRLQYYKHDKDKIIYLDKKKRQLQIDNNNKFSTISSSDIKDIQIFDSWNTNPLFSTLGYVKFNLQNGDSFIITRFTATKLDLKPLITGHNVTTTRKLLNAL